MLESRIMNRRTTVSADAEDLATLELEARRRGSSLSSVLAEAVEEKAIAIKRTRKPRLGLGRSTDGGSAAQAATEPIARPPR
jgi:hypothetical protein